MVNNIFQTKTPVKPRVLADERVYVYVPRATSTTAGIAAYDSKDFDLASGVVKLKRNDPFTTKTIVKLDNKDFKVVDDTTQIVWPKAGQASAEIGNTNGYGLVKIKPDGYLKFNEEGLLDANYDKFKSDLEENVKPIYGGKDNGFSDYDNYVDLRGIARKDELGNILLNLTKESIGLNKVENKAFSDYVYDNFSDNVKTTIDTKLNDKVDKTTWNRLFNDWANKNAVITTPHSWLEYLDAQQESIKDSLGAASLFLGFFETLDQLTLEYPAGVQYEKSMAYIIDTHTYWAVRQVNGEYEWYDTYIDDGNFYDRMETDINALRENGLVPSVGTSGKWINSDHVHPSDRKKVDKTLLQAMTINVTSNAPGTDDFVVKFWNKDASGAYVENPLTDLQLNIPYVRTGQYLHNWAGSINNFNGPNNEMYWAAGSDEFADLDIDAMPNGSLIIVDDGEGLEAGTFVSELQLLRQGIEISSASKDRFVIADKSVDTTGLIITTEKVNDKIVIKSKEFAHPVTAGFDPMVVVIPQANGNTISGKYFEPGKLLKFSDYGTPEETDYIAYNVLRTSNKYEVNLLPAGKLLITGESNTVATYDSGSIANKVITTDGDGGIKTIDLEPNKLLIAGFNGELSYFNMTPDQVGQVIGVSAAGTPTLMSQTIVPTSLPVQSFNENPSVPQPSTVLVFANPEGEYMDGCLYFY